MKALGPLGVCTVSVVLMNIFQWSSHFTGIVVPIPGTAGAPPPPPYQQPNIAHIGEIPLGTIYGCLPMICLVLQPPHRLTPRWLAAGLPTVTAVWWAPLYGAGRQVALALIICFIDICESISIAKSLAQVRWERASGELGQGWDGAMILGHVCNQLKPRSYPNQAPSLSHFKLQRNKYVLNANQELRGLGLANLAGAAFNCYTTTGSFSRSAVNNSVG